VLFEKEEKKVKELRKAEREEKKKKKDGAESVLFEYGTIVVIWL